MKMNEQIKSYLKQKFINVPDIWISECVAFIVAEDGNRNKDNFLWIKEKVYEQWLHADLTALGTCCLPFNLPKQKISTLRGKYALQINSLEDIGLPAYTQLQKLRKDDVENTSVSADKSFAAAWEPKPSRMLLLQLTDGTSIIQGMEYRPIQSLSLSLKAGTKILVQGDIEVRRGIMLLTNDLITVLGGEAESLLITNAPENVIRRNLGMEISEDPIAIPESFASSGYLPEESTPFDNKWTSSTMGREPMNKIKNEVRTPVHVPQNISNCNNQFKDDFDDDFEEDLMDVETDLALIEAERKASASYNQKNITNQPRSILKNTLGQILQVPSVTSTSVPLSTSVRQVNNFNERKFEPPCIDTSANKDFDDDDDDLILAAAEMTMPSVFESKFSSHPPSFSKANVVNSNKIKTEKLQSYKVNTQNKFKICSWEQKKPNSDTKQMNQRASQLGKSSVCKPLMTKTQSKLASFKFEKKSKPTDANRSYGESSNFPLDPMEAKDILRKKPIDANRTYGESSTFRLDHIEERGILGSKTTDRISCRESPKDFPLNRTQVKDILGSRPPYQYICYMTFQPLEKIIYTIKGFVSTLLTKLKQNNGKWDLAVKINDGTGFCDADIDNQVLQKLMGMSVGEFKEQSEQVSSNPQLKKDLLQRVGRCQMELINMCSLFQIEVDPYLPRPRVIDILPMTEIHLKQLQDRAALLFKK